MSKLFLLIFLIIFGFSLASNFVHAADKNFELVTCGDQGEPECTLCDLFEMLQRIFSYLTLTVLGVVTLFIIVIVGLMFLFGAVNPQALETAKKAFKTTVIGFGIVLACWLIIAEVGRAIGWTKATSEGGKGSWWKIDCNPGGTSGGP